MRTGSERFLIHQIGCELVPLDYHKVTKDGNTPDLEEGDKLWLTAPFYSRLRTMKLQGRGATLMECLVGDVATTIEQARAQPCKLPPPPMVGGYHAKCRENWGSNVDLPLPDGNSRWVPEPRRPSSLGTRWTNLAGCQWHSGRSSIVIVTRKERLARINALRNAEILDLVTPQARAAAEEEWLRRKGMMAPDGGMT